MEGKLISRKGIRKNIKGIKPGVKVSVHSLDKETITIKTNPTSWVERTRGIAKDAWRDIDTTKYLEDLRNEWDRKA